MTEVDPHRLPRQVLPSRYDLTLAPDLHAATFEGTVEIAVDVREPTTRVMLNAIELEIDHASVEVGGQRRSATVTLEEATERVTLDVADELPVGPATITLRFRGLLNDKLRGFYRSTYTDHDGVEQVIATTQFQATDARRCFPCWDEPDCKAVFGVTLVIDDGLLAVSNAAVASDQLGEDGRRTVRFADTMVMSTYLVAFVVGPLTATEPLDVAGTPTRIVSQPGKAHLTSFGLEVAEFSLRYLADYFDIPYPGDSMDLVGLPDFAFGAMENVGCVTFRETLLLADPETATQPEILNVVDVIAHELAHMWFGDLVTMKWWNGIWLNEAFATFMEMKVTDAFRPEWHRWATFGLSRSVAFDTDALGSTRAIEYPVISPHDAQGMFDVLTYEKGAAVVRMLEQYLGEAEFRSGIRLYMRKHLFGNTDTTDLWDAIEEATGEPVRRIMDSWIFQGGHPLVTVSLSDDGKTLLLEQTPCRFLADADDDGRWIVPLQIRYGTVNGRVMSTRTILEGDRAELLLDEPATWVVANAGGHGFFRVRPSTTIRDALTRDLQGTLSAIERYGLIDDAWVSVLGGTTTAAEFLTLAEAYHDEDDISVWRRLVTTLGQLDRIVDGAGREELRSRVRALVSPAMERIGWDVVDGEDSGDRELRGALMHALAVLANDADAQARVGALFARIRAGERIESNVAAAVVRATASLATDAELDELLAGFRNGSTPQEEQRYLYSLADVGTAEHMTKVLDLAMSGEVRTQNAPYLIGACIANRDHGHLAWRLIHERWDEMNDRFPENSIVRMLSGIRTVSDPALAADIRAFTAEHPVPQGHKSLEQHVERMRVSVALREREAERLG